MKKGGPSQRPRSSKRTTKRTTEKLDALSSSPSSFLPRLVASFGSLLSPSHFSSLPLLPLLLLLYQIFTIDPHRAPTLHRCRQTQSTASTVVLCRRLCVLVYVSVCFLFIFSFSALVLTGEVHSLVRFLFPYLLDLVLLPFFLFFRRVRAELLACLRAREG